MATDPQQVLITPMVASDQRPRLSPQIPEPLPPSPSNPGATQRYDPRMPQHSVIKSESNDDLSFSNLWAERYRCKSGVESGASTGNNVATAHAASGGSRLPQPLRAGRLCGDVGGTNMPLKDVIVISSDDESSDGETYDSESYDDESHDDESSEDESSDEQPKSGSGCPPAPLPISRTTPSTKLSRLANETSTCQSGQASAPNHTTRNNTAPATDVASLVKHKAALPGHGCQRDPRLFAEPCGTTSNDDNSKCLSHDERDKHHLRHHVQGPHRPASSQKDARQISDGRYRSASHDHHGGGDQTSGSAYRHPLVPDEAGGPTKSDPVRLLHVQERKASPSVVPDHQSISEPKPADAEPRFQYRSSPSAASKHGPETQHRSGSSALSQHRDHHDNSSQTNDRKNGDSQLLGDRGEQGVGSPVATSQIRKSGASIPRSSEATSNNDRVLADVGSPVQPSVQPSASQDLIGLQHSLGRRPCSGTDVGENHRPVEDGVRQPPRKRRRITSQDPAVGETAPKRQVYNCASSRPRRAQRPTTRHATPHQRQRGNPKPRSSGVTSMAEQAQEKSPSVEQIRCLQARYWVKWKGYGPEHNSWEPDTNFDRCPQLLDQFHQKGPVTTEPPSPSQLEIPKPRSAGRPSTTKEAQREYFDVENILGYKVWYLVKYAGYKRSRWVPAEQLDQCSKLLLQFHERMGSVKELITSKIAAQMEARRSAA